VILSVEREVAVAEDEPDLTVEGLARLHREVADAVDLAIAGDAPFPLLQKLAAARGLMQALGEVPKHVLMRKVVANAARAMAEWQTWQAEKRAKVVA
jgi:hypothetical protein